MTKNLGVSLDNERIEHTYFLTVCDEEDNEYELTIKTYDDEYGVQSTFCDLSDDARKAIKENFKGKYPHETNYQEALKFFLKEIGRGEW